MRPLAGKLPGEHEPQWRRPNQDLSDLALAAVDAALEPPPAHARFDDDGLQAGLAETVRSRPPAADAGGEHFEGAIGRCGYAHCLAHRREFQLRRHYDFSFERPA